MPLPKIDFPTYSVLLPLSKQTVEYRPFLVKEEKLLLMARETTDSKAKYKAIKQVITNCVLTKLDVDNLPTADLELLFLKLRAISVNNKSIIKIKDDEDQKDYEIVVDLEQATINTNNLPEAKIQLTPEIGVVMKYPTVKTTEQFVDMESTPEYLIKYVIAHIDYVYDSNDVYYMKDSTPEEAMEFIDSLSESQFLQLREFLTNIPVLECTVEYKPKSGKKKSVTIKGINSFF